MAVLKCKMCGGDIIAAENQTYGTCDSCGSTVTIPRIDDARMENMFNRANHFRMICEFDKAVATYEMILNEDNSNAEAHWGLLISRHGIEYVEDPVSHERIPTCHRIQMDSVLSDSDYLSALEHASDSYTRSLYEAEGKRLAELQRGLLQVSAQAEPFDVFICYKETTEGGSRTKDSALAQDIYYQLSNAGYKVFFSRITLENILGQQYEPHIFAALNSAKVMLAIGTKPEYFNAVWVKNEWSRFLALAKKDKNKVLIPCYRDMNVYDLPDELSMLQSQDMGKIGFVQDLLHGIEKVIQAQNVTTQQPGSVSSQAAAPGVDSLYKRALLFLEDEDWKTADEYFDRILDIDPEFAPAYIGKLCAEKQLSSEGKLKDLQWSIAEEGNYKKALRFANTKQADIYESYNQAILDRIAEENRKAAEERRQREEQERLRQYNIAISGKKNAVSKKEFSNLVTQFKNLGDYKDAVLLAKECSDVVAQFEIEEQREAEIQQAQNKKRAAKIKRIIAVIGVIASVVFIALIVYISVIKPVNDYKTAMLAFENQHYDEAIVLFESLGEYKDSLSMAKECQYQKGQKYYANKSFATAEAAFSSIPGYRDADAMAKESRYEYGLFLFENKKYAQAIEVFESLVDYKDTSDESIALQYQLGVALLENDQYDAASETFTAISGYNDAATMALECQYQKGCYLMGFGTFKAAGSIFDSIVGYKDSEDLLIDCIYRNAIMLIAEGKYDMAQREFESISDYKDAEDMVKECTYREAMSYLHEGQSTTAQYYFKQIPDYKDVAEILEKIQANEQ